MKKIAIVILSFLLSITLSAVLALYVLTHTFGSGQTVKSWVKDSDIVGLGVKNALVLVDDIELDEAVKQDIGERLQEPVAEKVLEPQLEMAIGEFYSWLEAPKYELLNFVVDLGSNNQEIIKRVGAIVEDHYDDLPICDETSQPKQDGSNEDGEEDFQLCRDPDANASQVADEITKQLTDNEGLLKPVEVKYEAGSDADNTLSSVYDWVRFAKSAHILLILALLLFGLPIVFLSKNHIIGVRRLSRALINSLAIPVILALAVLIFLPETFGLDKIDFGYTGNNPELFHQTINQTFSPLIREVALDMTKVYLRIALPLLVLATGTWFFARHLVHEQQRLAKKKK